MRRTLLFSIPLLCFLLLLACGGSGSGSGEPQPAWKMLQGNWSYASKVNGNLFTQTWNFQDSLYQMGGTGDISGNGAYYVTGQQGDSLRLDLWIYMPDGRRRPSFLNVIYDRANDNLYVEGSGPYVRQ